MRTKGELVRLAHLAGVAMLRAQAEQAAYWRGILMALEYVERQSVDFDWIKAVGGQFKGAVK